MLRVYYSDEEGYYEVWYNGKKQHFYDSRDIAATAALLGVAVECRGDEETLINHCALLRVPVSDFASDQTA